MHRFTPPDDGEVGIKPEELMSALREWQESVPLWPVEVVRSFNCPSGFGSLSTEPVHSQTQSKSDPSHLPHPHHCHTPQVACTGTRQTLTSFAQLFNISESANEVESWNSVSS